MKCPILFAGIHKKIVINLAYAELAQRLGLVNNSSQHFIPQSY